MMINNVRLELYRNTRSQTSLDNMEDILPIQVYWLHLEEILQLTTQSWPKTKAKAQSKMHQQRNRIYLDLKALLKRRLTSQHNKIIPHVALKTCQKRDLLISNSVTLEPRWLSKLINRRSWGCWTKSKM